MSNDPRLETVWKFLLTPQRWSNVCVWDHVSSIFSSQHIPDCPPCVVLECEPREAMYHSDASCSGGPIPDDSVRKHKNLNNKFDFISITQIFRPCWWVFKRVLKFNAKHWYIFFVVSLCFFLFPLQSLPGIQASKSDAKGNSVLYLKFLYTLDCVGLCAWLGGILFCYESFELVLKYYHPPTWIEEELVRKNYRAEKRRRTLTESGDQRMCLRARWRVREQLLCGFYPLLNQKHNVESVLLFVVHRKQKLIGSHWL